MTLKELEIGKSAVVTQVGGEGALRQHFLDMGMIPGAEVTVVKFAPMGDPMELQIVKEYSHLYIRGLVKRESFIPKRTNILCRKEPL